MGSYMPNTIQERREMLHEIGMNSYEELYVDIPRTLRVQEPLKLPKGLSELEVFREVSGIADRSKRFYHIFRGAGAYNHYIPAIVKQITHKEEFVTAYTPYQAEISQGLLQSIFEYQTMICELTGMDVSNASVYDGATAAAEALTMCKDRKRKKVCVSATVDPKVLSVIKTYCFGNDTPLIILPEKDGTTDLKAWEDLNTDEIACLYVQTPNYYGLLEDGDQISAVVHEAGAKLIMGCNPISLGILKAPREYGADVAVGEGQPLGMPMGFGGPYLGYMSTTKDMMRRLPGRIVGQTKDIDGQTGYVLTLQAREQHIRREKANSNICSNEALCAMTAAVYLSAMGCKGLQKVAVTCMSSAHYLLERLETVGLVRKYTGEFFHEFVTICPYNAYLIARKLSEKGYLSGLPLNEEEMLWCVTEMNTKSEMDELISIIKEVLP